jgi:hypothetical protein
MLPGGVPGTLIGALTLNCLPTTWLANFDLQPDCSTTRVTGFIMMIVGARPAAGRKNQWLTTFTED